MVPHARAFTALLLTMSLAAVPAPGASKDIAIPTSLTDTVDAVAGLGGVATTTKPARARSLGDAIELLTTAVDEARAVVLNAVPQERSFQRRAAAAMRDLRPSDGRTGAHPSTDRFTALAARVDRAALLRATQSLARAIDAAMPALAAADVPLSAGTCAIVDTEAVCVSGDGDDLYTEDRALIVDLGGNDRYENGAGLATGAFGNGLAVSVVLDVWGDDRYLASAGQGAGAFGIGILVDALGADSYLLEGASVSGQGFGSAGVGVLADLDGNDAYAATASGVGGLSGGPSGTGRGFGFLGGIGIAFDAGGINRWSMESIVEPDLSDGTLLLGTGSIIAHGAGAAAGIGSFADAAGASPIVMKVRPSGEVPVDLPGFAETPGPSSISGAGWGLVGGIGVARTGHVDTRWDTSVTVRGVNAGTAWLQVYGWAQQGAVGTLVDLGGDDVYAAVADARATSIAHGDPACGCVPAVADAGVRAAIGSISSGFGLGLLGGIASLTDAGGDDLYVMESRTGAFAEAFDGGDAGTSARATVSEAQGFGMGYGNGGGIGTLEDASGDDAYSTIVDATASADVFSSGPTEADASTEPAIAWVQGLGILGGQGVMRDLGGNDSYRSSVTTGATSTGSAIAAPPAGWAQGVGLLAGFGTLLDLGGADAFFSTPHRVPCVGARGDGFWIDCGDPEPEGTGLGVGLNP